MGGDFRRADMGPGCLHSRPRQQIKIMVEIIVMMVMMIPGQLSGVPKLPLLLRGSVWAREGGVGEGVVVVVAG